MERLLSLFESDFFYLDTRLNFSYRAVLEGKLWFKGRTHSKVSSVFPCAVDVP